MSDYKLRLIKCDEMDCEFRLVGHPDNEQDKRRFCCYDKNNKHADTSSIPATCQLKDDPKGRPELFYQCQCDGDYVCPGCRFALGIIG